MFILSKNEIRKKIMIKNVLCGKLINCQSLIPDIRPQKDEAKRVYIQRCHVGQLWICVAAETWCSECHVVLFLSCAQVHGSRRDLQDPTLQRFLEQQEQSQSIVASRCICFFC